MRSASQEESRLRSMLGARCYCADSTNHFLSVTLHLYVVNFTRLTRVNARESTLNALCTVF